MPIGTADGSIRPLEIENPFLFFCSLVARCSFLTLIVVFFVKMFGYEFGWIYLFGLGFPASLVLVFFSLSLGLAASVVYHKAETRD